MNTAVCHWLCQCPLGSCRWPTSQKGRTAFRGAIILTPNDLAGQPAHRAPPKPVAHNPPLSARVTPPVATLRGVMRQPRNHQPCEPRHADVLWRITYLANASIASPDSARSAERRISRLSFRVFVLSRFCDNLPAPSSVGRFPERGRPARLSVAGETPALRAKNPPILLLKMGHAFC
jgi:hypothetical protein